MTDRSDVVRVARLAIDTPFHHRAREPGIGLDCAGLVISVARTLALVDADFEVPEYGRIPDGSTMLAWCREHMRCISADEVQAGDIVVTIADMHPQHMGIVGDYRHGGFSLIHAANNAHPPRVIETRLMYSRRQRLVAAFALPGIA